MSESQPVRRIATDDIVLPGEYRIELVAKGLTLPSSMAIAPNGDIYVTEMGQNLRQPTIPARILRIRNDGSFVEVASGFTGTLTGLAFHEGDLFVAENDWPAHIVRIAPDGTKTTIISGLPGGGDHPTNGIVFGPDGHMYFGQGTVTNSGVVGLDNMEIGWLPHRPNIHDVPGQRITLAGENFTTSDPFVSVAGERAVTGGFVAFDTETTPDFVEVGSRKCSGSIIRSDTNGDFLQLVAWGFRETFGLAFSPDGRLYCTENGMEPRGSRPISGDVDRLWEVKADSYYGWPDFVGGEPVTSPRFRTPNTPPLSFLLKDHPLLAGPPLVSLDSLTGVAKLDFCPRGPFGFEGQAFVATTGEHGPHVPLLHHVPSGARILRVNVDTGQMETFAANSREDSDSHHTGGGFEKPIDIKFDAQGESMYVLDYGIVSTEGNRPRPVEGSGVLWRILRQRSHSTTISELRH